MPENIRRFINKEFTISAENYETGWNMPYHHYHNDYEVYVLESGERTITIDDEEYVTAARDAALFAPNHPHGSKGTSPFSGICIHFSQGFLDRHLTSTAKKVLLACFDTPVISLSPEIFALIRQYAGHFVLSAPGNFAILIHILYMLNTLKDSASHDSGAHDGGCAHGTGLRSPLVPASAGITRGQQILAFVADNYTAVESIAQLADSFGVSEGYIFKIFRQAYNKTPKEYINELRINHACYRLKNTDNTISDIAGECGYECYAYFTRLFKRMKGITPAEYRRSSLKKDSPFSG